MEQEKEKCKENTIKTFNKDAHTYDEKNYKQFYKGCYSYVIDECSKISFENVLDIGCGTGNVIALLAEQKNDLKIYGVDIAEEMIKISKEKLKNNKNIILTQGDAENLPYEDEKFDLVLCTETFHHYTEPLKVMQEIKRVLKPSGKVLIYDSYAEGIFRNILNFLVKFTKKGDVKIYSKEEITEYFATSQFRNIDWKQNTKFTYICTGQK